MATTPAPAKPQALPTCAEIEEALSILAKGTGAIENIVMRARFAIESAAESDAPVFTPTLADIGAMWWLMEGVEGYRHVLKKQVEQIGGTDGMGGLLCALDEERLEREPRRAA